MDSTTYFKTQNGCSYLYDLKNSYLLNIHPIIDSIWQSEIENETDNLSEKLKSLYPELSFSDISYYIRKYKFFKENGFFKTFEVDELLSGKITSGIVENQVANIDSVVFQVTGDCNLKCRYCCYGDMYTDAPNKGPMTFETVQHVFDFLIPYWNSTLNLSYEHTIGIAFYGGEPLLNFPLIRQIIDFCKNMTFENNMKVTYSMTTNAMLLNKYADYIVAHDFALLISLDGNEEHDKLRVDVNNRPSFDRVFKNIKKFQQDYPAYFEKKVQFNSVLNKSSSVEEVHNFIYKEFGKIPLIESISSTELNNDNKQEYEQIFQSYDESPEMITKRLDRSPLFKDLGSFFYYQLNNSYKHYCEVMYGNKKIQKKIPTGTCLPFFKKMYVTSDGNLLACERIGLHHILGNVNDKVNIDYKQIAENYNRYFSVMKKQCEKCYLIENCGECLFQFPFKDGLPVCPYQFNKKQYQMYLAKLFNLLEMNPDFFNKINKTVFA